MIPVHRILVLPLWALALSIPIVASAQSFETMAQPVEADAGCKAPRPPKELDSFAYVRNGYREILRIIAIQAALDEEACECPFEKIDWQAVVEASEAFKTSDNPKLPFDVIGLRKQADALKAELGQLCSG